MVETGSGDDLGADVVAVRASSVGRVAGNWSPWFLNWVALSGVQGGEDSDGKSVQESVLVSVRNGRVTDDGVDLHGPEGVGSIDVGLDVLGLLSEGEVVSAF